MAKTEPAFLFSHGASLWVRPDGLPDRSRPILVADGPLGLALRRADLGLDVTVAGKPLPPGTGGWVRRDTYQTVGTGPGYEYRSLVQFRGASIVATCTVRPARGRPRPEVRAVKTEAGRRAEAGIWSTQSGPGGVSESDLWFARVASSWPVPVEAEAPPERGPRIVLEGPAEDAMAVRRLEFQLGPEEFEGFTLLTPFGATSEQYSGRVFWDADLWMLPALALTHPRQAAAVPHFRLLTEGEARREFDAWLAVGRPVGQDADGTLRKLGPLAKKEAGLKVPWETGPDGQEKCRTEGRWAHHATAAAAWGMQFAARLGLASSSMADRYIELAAAFYHARATPFPQGRFTVRDTLSPDENAHTPDDAYTNLAADLVLQAAGRPLGSPYLPFDPVRGKLLNYTGDRGARLNQHALLLAVWPLQHPTAVAEAKSILASCRGRANPDGPAMSLPVEAVVEARYGDPDRALDAWRRGLKAMHGPDGLMGESRRRPGGVFRTGAAALWSALVYGFAGIHVDDVPLTGANRSVQLRSGVWVSCKPNLPKAWRSVSVRLVLDGRPRVWTATHGAVEESRPD